jgi:hypothetical protein
MLRKNWVEWGEGQRWDYPGSSPEKWKEEELEPERYVFAWLVNSTNSGREARIERE